MEWQQIIGFYHVARLGSFTKAAEATFRTQSALSQQVKGLETELCCLLFERIGTRRIRLTPEGEKFLGFAEEVLQKFELVVDSMREKNGIHRGTLRLAAPFTTLYHLLPQVIRGYSEQFPHVQLTILDRSQGRVIELVQNGDVDLGLTLESVVPPSLTPLRWRKVEPVLMAPIGHPLTFQLPVTMEQVARFPLILPPKVPGSLSRLNLEDRLQRLAIPYRVAMESSNVDLSSVYVEMGLGIAFATVVRDIGAPPRRGLEFVAVDHLLDTDYLVVVSRKRVDLSPHKAAFLDLLLSTRTGTA